MRRAVTAPGAPRAIGPYSQAVVAGDLVFASGQTPLDPATGELVGGDVAVQTRRVLDNLEAVLGAAGTDLHHAVKVTVYLTSMDDFAAMNEVYAGRFGDPPPARSTVAVRALPRGARVEIDVVATLR